MSNTNPFPTPFYLFFCWVEPLLTYIGVWKTLSDPALYFRTLIPAHRIWPAASASRIVGNNATMAIRQLGGCYFILANMGFFLLRPLLPRLRQHPSLLHAVLFRYLAILAISDVIHIGLTFYDLGLEGTKDWRRWNQLVWGNVGVTTVLFVGRTAWFVVYGRKPEVKEGKTE
ncbi:hypothetical protein BT69DRAFT_1277055 [Atractiella rhizophila]|nr:hypothetical protein BT69DRAFT_1277055 [Atractiella rhizophila]